MSALAEGRGNPPGNRSRGRKEQTVRISKGKEKGSRPKLESQNDEAYLTGRRTAQESEKQIRTPLQRERGAAHNVRVKGQS